MNLCLLLHFQFLQLHKASVSDSTITSTKKWFSMGEREGGPGKGTKLMMTDHDADGGTSHASSTRHPITHNTAQHIIIIIIIIDLLEAGRRADACNGQRGYLSCSLHQNFAPTLTYAKICPRLTKSTAQHSPEKVRSMMFASPTHQ